MTSDVDTLVGVDLASLDDADLVGRLTELEHLRRRLDAAMATTVGEVDRRKLWKPDGHASVRGLLRATLNWSTPTIVGFCRTARVLRDVDQVRDAAESGSIGVDQTRELARANAHPRAGDRFAEFASMLVDQARRLPFNDFKTCVARWEQLADPDGADDDADTTHQGRTASLWSFDGVFRLDARGGTVDGTAMTEIFEQFLKAEFERDWAATVAVRGDRASASLMPRTDAQRRFDALVAIFDAAVTAPAGTTPEPVVQIIVDQDTFAMALARAFGVLPVDPGTVDWTKRRCETSTGRPVAPAEMIAAAVCGHVQRVVLDSASVVIDLGRRSRLFTGSARTAALFDKTTCLWPGCDRPAARCQVDHHRDWGHHGTTSPRNGGPGCARHNRAKNRGFRVTRDPGGNYHVYRPDGTEIT